MADVAGVLARHVASRSGRAIVMVVEDVADEAVGKARPFALADAGEQSGGAEQDHARAEIGRLRRRSLRGRERRLLVHLEAPVLDGGNHPREIVEMGRQAFGRVARRGGHQPLGDEGVGIGVDLRRRVCLMRPFAARRTQTGSKLGVVAEIGVAGPALHRFQPRKEGAGAGIERRGRAQSSSPAKKPRVGHQRLEAAPLDPAIGEIRTAAPVRRAVVGEGQAVDLGVEEGALEGRAAPASSGACAALASI